MMSASPVRRSSFTLPLSFTIIPSSRKPDVVGLPSAEMDAAAGGETDQDRCPNDHEQGFHNMLFHRVSSCEQ
jgi:hypothetical protein